MITMINEDKDRTVVMAVLLSLEEMLKSMKQDVLQGEGNFEGICTAVKNVLMSKVCVLYIVVGIYWWLRYISCFPESTYVYL